MSVLQTAASGNEAAAPEQLGIARKTLYDKLKKYQLQGRTSGD